MLIRTIEYTSKKEIEREQRDREERLTDKKQKGWGIMKAHSSREKITGTRKDIENYISTLKNRGDKVNSILILEKCPTCGTREQVEIKDVSFIVD